MDYREARDFSQLSIFDRHVRVLETIERLAGAVPHNGPFDRIMLAQAKANELLLLTHDTCIAEYGESCVLRV